MTHQHQLVLLAVGVARSSRCRPHPVYPGSFIVTATHLSTLVASLTRPVDPSSHGVPVQLHFRLPLSSMWVPSALIFRVLCWSSSCGTARVRVSHDARTHAPLYVLQPLLHTPPGYPPPCALKCRLRSTRRKRLRRLSLTRATSPDPHTLPSEDSSQTPEFFK